MTFSCVSAHRAQWWVIPVLVLMTVVAVGCSGPDSEALAPATPTVTVQEATSGEFPTPTSEETTESVIATQAPETPLTVAETADTSPTAPPATSEATQPAPVVTPSQPIATPTTSAPAVTTADLGRVAVDIEQVGSGFDQPDFVTHAGDGSGRIFVLEKIGRIKLLDGTTYLDISDRVLWYDLLTVQHELGLLGLAFHPDFEQNGYFYVHYTDRNQDHVISRFTQGPDGRVDRATEKILLTYPQPEVNFVGGMLTFGRDGYLYIGMGTGIDDDPEQVVAQELDNLYGKLLRIDVNADPYGIPSDNPFVNTPGARGEIWALGLRNPWRFAFDRATNDLYIGGPGEFAREWVHFVADGNAGGLNFGWPILEGDECWEESPLPCETDGLVFPILTYPRGDGNCVVIGGYPYRGPSYQPLQGVYLYGDYCSGRIWGAARDASGAWNSVELLDSDMLITSFGEDEAGELYVTDGKGDIYRIVGQE